MDSGQRLSNTILRNIIYTESLCSVQGKIPVAHGISSSDRIALKLATLYAYNDPRCGLPPRLAAPAVRRSKSAAGLGNRIFNGMGPPPMSFGSIGDYYLDTTTGQLYGPKTESDSEN